MKTEKYTSQVQSLIREYAYRYSEEPFRLASGLLSNHYFNCKEITLHPLRLSVLTKAIVWELIPRSGLSIPEAIGGLTLGADPISYSVALEYLDQGQIVFPLVVRKQPKDHGTGKKIEGLVDSVKSCMVVDDVITTGSSTLMAVEILREAGIQVTEGICILDREEGGREILEQNQVRIHSLFKKSDFLEG